jgi:hypothetical protein
VIAHGGGINGFLSEAFWYPDEQLLVVVLQNSASQKGPALLARALIEATIGPSRAPIAGTYTGDLGLLAGTYRGPARGQEMTVMVSQAEGALTVQPRGAPEATRPMYVDGLHWRRGNALWFFDVDRDGRATTLHLDQGGGHYVLRRVEG